MDVLNDDHNTLFLAITILSVTKLGNKSGGSETLGCEPCDERLIHCAEIYLPSGLQISSVAYLSVPQIVPVMTAGINILAHSHSQSVTWYCHGQYPPPRQTTFYFVLIASKQAMKHDYASMP